MKFYPYDSYEQGGGGGGRKVSVMLKRGGGGGHKKLWVGFSTGARSFSHTEGGGGTQTFLMD